MPTIELTHAELGQLYDAANRGVEALDDTLDDTMNQQFYGEDEWSEMRVNRDRWARVVSILASAIEETANAND